MIDQIRIGRDDRPDWTVLTVTGQVDVATAPELRQALTEAQYGPRSRVALDLDGVEFLDSFGLGVIVGALKRARLHAGEVAIVCSRSRLLHLFEVTRLDRIVPVVATLDDLEPTAVENPR